MRRCAERREHQRESEHAREAGLVDDWPVNTGGLGRTLDAVLPSTDLPLGAAWLRVRAIGAGSVREGVLRTVTGDRKEET